MARRTFFDLSIMDSTRAEELGMSPLSDELQRIEKIENAIDLIQVVAYHKTIGVNSLFGLYSPIFVVEVLKSDGTCFEV